MNAVVCIGTRSAISPVGAMSSARASAPLPASASLRAPVKTRLRLTRRGRLVFTTLAAAPLVMAAFFLALNGGVAEASGAGTASGAADFAYITISAGESLWEIAESLAPAADPRDVIADIVNLNRLTSEDVQPGQRLALPNSF